jgi:hypothetical protein
MMNIFGNRMQSSRHILLIGAFVLPAAFGLSTARAQTNAAQVDTQQDVAQRNQTEAQRNALRFHVADRDLGEINLVSRQPQPKMFTFSTSQSFNYTSNAFLAPNNERDAVFYNGRLAASFVPYSTRDFTPRLTFEQNFFRYDRFSQLDFDSQSLTLDLKYDLNRDDTWFVNGSYGVTRLYAPHGNAGEFYKFGLLSGNVTHTGQFGQSPFYYAGTVGGNWRQGEPSTFDRITTYFSMVVLYSPIEHVQLSAFLRPELQFYLNDPAKDTRQDLNLSLGTSITWTPIEYVSIGGTLAYVGNYSSFGARSYDVFAPSIVLNAQIAF